MSGRLAVVTGAGSGIGAAISETLVTHGYTVVPTDVDLASAEEVAVKCSSPGAYQIDVTDAAGIEEAVGTIVAQHGPLEAFVSNAGVSKMSRFLDITAEQLDATLAVNLRGLFLASQAAARTMVDAGTKGCIVNVASMAGKQGRVPFLADYVASKFGVIGLTQAMAFELARYGIRVNSVCPGYVSTPMQQRELGWEAELRGVSVETVRQLYVADTPLGRLETPLDVARAVAFLVSEEASFITGEALAVNGGAFMD